MRQNKPAPNSAYPKVTVLRLNQALCFHPSLCLVDSEVLRNHHIQVAENRYVSLKKYEIQFERPL